MWIVVLLGSDIVRDMLRDEENKAHTSLSASSSSNSLNSAVCYCYECYIVECFLSMVLTLSGLC